MGCTEGSHMHLKLKAKRLGSYLDDLRFNILKLLKSPARSSGQMFSWQVTEVWMFPKNSLAAASACQEAVCVHLASDKVSWGTQRHRNQHEAFWKWNNVPT